VSAPEVTTAIAAIARAAVARRWPPAAASSSGARFRVTMPATLPPMPSSSPSGNSTPGAKSTTLAG